MINKFICKNCGIIFYDKYLHKKRVYCSRKCRNGYDSKLRVHGDSKECTQCHLIKSFSDYHKLANRPLGLNARCRDCRSNIAKERFIRNREAESHKRRYQHIKSRYGLSPEEYDAMCEIQDGKCAICQRSRPLTIDHNHKTDAVRGLLCYSCNSFIGMAQDNIEILQKAIEYLCKYEK